VAEQLTQQKHDVREFYDKVSLSHTHSLSLAISLSLARSGSLSVPGCLARALSLARSLSLSRSLSLAHSLSFSLSHPQVTRETVTLRALVDKNNQSGFSTEAMRYPDINHIPLCIGAVRLKGSIPVVSRSPHSLSKP